ncbi:hypothetical protein L3Q82_005089 [Scortum barcoo]|uniref:Uncharacterized protein n=1 Tax=Scortum barcoo TaxID=214431 RepID=A0ACB8VG48_9TELE|nr:hypothetical protein L3Q82_005089 [Scortum barcoo]
MFRHTPTTTRPWTSCMELSTGQRPHGQEAAFIVAGDFNSANLRKVLPRYHQHISCPTRGENTLDHVYTPYADTYKALPRSPFGKSDHASLLLLPSYRQKLKRDGPVTRTIQQWSDQSDFGSARLLQHDGVTFPNQKPWVNGEVRAKLKARTDAYNSAVEVQKAQEDHCPPVISRADVCRTLKRINTRKAPGPDGIPGRALKVCADQLADVFADIFNMSLLQSVVPTCFKETIIVPVPKKTKILCLNDYRPVALTSTIMKCFERLVKSFITSSILDSLDPLQFAYRPNRSTEDAISLTLHTALSHLDQRDTYLYRNTIVPSKLVTKLIVDFRRRQREEHAPLSINGTTVERVNSFRFLGVHISEDLTWTHTLTLSQSQPDSGSSSSAGCRGSTWTSGYSAASTAELEQPVRRRYSAVCLLCDGEGADHCP